MATVTGYTAARMQEIEDNAIVDGEVIAGNLILTKYGGGTINAGSVIGPTGEPGITAEEFAGTSPVGSITDYIGTVAPPKWVILDGSSIPNGQSLYPELWAILPAMYKSGSTIVLPDTRGRMVVGRNPSDALFDNIGDSGGSKDAIVVSHSHTAPSHQHSGPSHRHTTPNHSHSASGTATNAGSHSHAHTLGTGANGSHYHTIDGGQGYKFVIQKWTTGIGAVQTKDTSTPSASAATSVTGTDYAPDHTHTITGSITSGGAHTHPLTISIPDSGGSNTGYDGTGLTGAAGGTATTSAGSSGTGANLPPYITFSKIMRVVN